MIIDLSEWQPPGAIDYDALAPQLTGAIVRVQYGSGYEDLSYQQHLKELQSRGIPCAVYAWVRGGSLEAMAQEARLFYTRASGYAPVFWWLDVEEFSMGDMRAGCEVYRRTLKECGAKYVGAYIANHLYHQLNLDTSAFDAIWLPTYGGNTGHFEGAVPTATSNYQLHQYTSNAHLHGYEGALDASRPNGVSFSQLFPTAGSQESVKFPDKNFVKGELPMKTFTLETEVYLQSKPSIYAATIALLSKNSVVLIQDISFNEGYLWGEQLRENGTTAYIAMAEIQPHGKLD